MSMFVDCKGETTNYYNRDATMTAYLQSIRHYPVLTSDEERALLYKVHNGSAFESQQARERLVQCNQRFVISVARRSASATNLMDIIGEANLGLMMAIDKFKLEKEQRFVTYAIYWIKKYINDYLITMDKAVIPNNAHKIFNYANKARSAFFAEEGRYPTADELKDYLLIKYNVDVPYKEDLMAYNMNSIDDNGSNGESDENIGNLRAFDNATCSNNVDEHIDNVDSKTKVNTLMSFLSPKEKMVVSMHFGIDCEPMTYTQIGEKMELSSERIRQIVKKALKELSNHEDAITDDEDVDNFF